MKKLFIASLVSVLVPMAVQADDLSPRLVNADGSALTELCIAAASASSPAAGLNPIQRKELLCNGKPVDQFVLQLRDQKKQYVFQATDKSDFSKLCLAAVESEESYRAVREQLSSRIPDAESSVYCNGIPLKSFSRKYRNKNYTAAL